MSHINLSKEERVQKIDLRKKDIVAVLNEYKISMPTDVHIEMDRSISMNRLYRDGIVQDIFERMMPIAIELDQNRTMDCGIFHNKHTDLPDINIDNFHEYVKREVMTRAAGGTEYAPAIKAIVDKHTKKVGLFGKKRKCSDKPILVLFFTDGDNSDKPEAEEALAYASNYNLFFQFIGIGRSTKHFLERMDKGGIPRQLIDNAGFFDLGDDIDHLDKHVSDQDLYRMILKEYPEWLERAKSVGIL